MIKKAKKLSSILFWDQFSWSSSRRVIKICFITAANKRIIFHPPSLACWGTEWPSFTTLCHFEVKKKDLFDCFPSILKTDFFRYAISTPHFTTKSFLCYFPLMLGDTLCPVTHLVCCPKNKPHEKVELFQARQFELKSSGEEIIFEIKRISLEKPPFNRGTK